MSESEQASNAIQPAASPTPTAGGNALPAGDRFETDAALLRLVIGALLLGTDELRDRLRRWEEEAARSSPTAQVATPPQTARASPRSALLGMAFAAETRVRRGFATMLAGLARLADDTNLGYTRLTFAVRGTPLDALRARLDELLFLALVTVDRWTARGAMEEQQGRRMAERATAGTIDELLDYMARNPEVRHLIEQQGVGIADSAVGEVRERTASADQWIERLAHNLLHRPLGDKPARSADGDSAGVAAATPPVGKRPVPSEGSTEAKIPTRMPGARPRRSAAAAEEELPHSAGGPG